MATTEDINLAVDRASILEDLATRILSIWAA